MKLTNGQISILKDMLDEFSDRLRHHPDAEMGWDSDDVDEFSHLYSEMMDEAKGRGFWWAQR